MKNLIKTVAVVLLAVSCQRVQMVAPQTQYGSLGVSLKTESEMVTKADPGVTLNPSDLNLTPSDLNLKIVEKTSPEPEPVYNGKYGDYTSLTLPMNHSYTVSAENCTAAEAEAGNGQIRVYGSQEVTINSLSNDVSFTCTVQNARVEVAFDPSVATYASDVQVVLKSGSRSPLTIPYSSASTICWFNPTAENGFSWTISGTLKNNTNTSINKSGSRTLAAKDNIRLNVSINADNGQLIITQEDITINTEISGPDKIDVTYNPYK